MVDRIIQERFWAKVHQTRPGQCWLWSGAKTPAGYGKMAVNRVTRYAHHLVLEIDGRARPTDAIALHSCDNPGCVNPAHLTWGSQKENMRQAISRGRSPHTGRVAGEKNGNAVLTEEQVAEIRKAVGTHSAVAGRFGVSRSLVQQIRAGTAWRHSCPPASI